MKRVALNWVWTLVLVMLFCGTEREVYGQDKVRKYANVQQINAGLLTSVDNPGYAVNGNIQLHSTINRLLGVGALITVTQFLEFDVNQPAGTPVTVKLTFPQSILSLLGGVEVQPFTNLRNNLGTLFTWQADPVGVGYTGANLLGLLNGAGDLEITITPQSSGGSPLQYKGVWIKLSGVAVGQSLNLFHAYVKENAPTALSCEVKNAAIDVLSGVRAGTVVGGIANATGSVSNAYDAIDANLSTSALISTGAQVLSEVFHTTVFQTASIPNQVVRFVLQNQGGQLLDLNLLSTATIQPYLNNVAVGTPVPISQNFLSLKLLPGNSNKYEIVLKVPSSFDRVELKLGGVASVLSSLRLYEVSRLPSVILVNPIEFPNLLTDCGQVDLVKAIANYQPEYYNYNFYTVSSGGSALSPSSTPNTYFVSTSGTYYIEAEDKVTGCHSLRLAVSANVFPFPGKPHLTISNTIN